MKYEKPCSREVRNIRARDMGRVRLKFFMAAGVAAVFGFTGHSTLAEGTAKPNILILMTDNQYAPHLGCYGDNVVKTPHIDRLAKQGVRFTNAFGAAPSCTPARAGYLTGQDIWRLEEGANLWGTLPKKFPVYTELLSRSGYFVGYEGKGWGPGNVPESGRKQNPAGRKFKSFEKFLEASVDGKPWNYWLCSKNPHRPYKLGSGAASGMNPEDVVVPPYLPDCEEIRSDICDYYLEIQEFDDLVGETTELLRETGRMDNTLVVICSDNGWQMPRGLASLYDFGSKVPLIISWKGQIQPGRVVDDYVNLNDLAPTFLELAHADIPREMTAKSLNNILFSDQSGRIEKDRNFIVTGLERHAMCRRDGVGYPGRAIRMDGYLYIRNFEPDRWPAGDPPLFGDIDAFQLHYYCPTKEYMMEHKDDPRIAPLYKLAFLQRPEEELFDLAGDPHQMTNLAADPKHAEMKKKLSDRLAHYLREIGDPRMTGGNVEWDDYTYHARNGFICRPRKEAREKFNLKIEYNYRDESVPEG